MKLIGILGLVLIIGGVLVRQRKDRDLIYTLGGLCLTVYSISIGDAIFIAMQIVFTSVSLYDYLRNRTHDQSTSA